MVLAKYAWEVDLLYSVPSVLDLDLLGVGIVEGLVLVWLRLAGDKERECDVRVRDDFIVVSIPSVLIMV